MRYYEILYSIGGKKDKIIIIAEHKMLAVKDFMERKIGILISIKEINEPISSKIKKFLSTIKESSFKTRVNIENYIAALRQLTVMLDAGISVTVCFNEVINTTNDKQLKQIFYQISSDVEAGQSLSQSFERFSFELGNITLSMIKLGEQTGTLSESIGKLALILEEVYENKRKLKKALRYPIIILITMIIAFISIIKMIVPQFKNMFEEYDSELPLPTQILIGLNSFLTQYGIFIIFIIILLVAIHIISYRSSKKYKFLSDKIIQKLYLIGKLNYLSMVGRFIFVFDKLTNSGIPIVESINISKKSIENSYLKSKFDVIEKAIENGKSLAEGFQDSKEFEQMVIQMIKAGESSGSLNVMLEKIDKYYSDKYNDLVDNISTYIEPIMIFLLAVFLTLMALGIFLPMWNMADVIN